MVRVRGVAHFRLRGRAGPGGALPTPLIEVRVFAVCRRPYQIGPRSRLVGFPHGFLAREARVVFAPLTRLPSCSAERRLGLIDGETQVGVNQFKEQIAGMNKLAVHNKDALDRATNQRSEEPTSELPSLMCNSSSVFRLKKKTNKHQ